VTTTGDRRRVGFGDEIWRLARAGDREALERAADVLGAAAGDEPDYDAQRARAFALALGRRGADAVAALEHGWTDDWPFPAAYATDIARVRYLAGEYDEALIALRLAVRGVERHLDESVPELTIACVERSPRVWRRALTVALGGGTARQQLALALAVLRARV
jgi:hypothetical protein